MKECAKCGAEMEMSDAEWNALTQALYLECPKCGAKYVAIIEADDFESVEAPSGG